jgi:transposase
MSNGLEWFLSYVKEGLMKHLGMSPGKFPLYINEMKFRYNHRDDIYHIVAKYLM